MTPLRRSPGRNGRRNIKCNERRVRALDVIVIDFTGWPNWASSWAIAGVLIVLRWTVLLRSGHSSSPVAQAAESYPATPELSYLSIGLLAQNKESAAKHRKGPLSALPSRLALSSR